MSLTETPRKHPKLEKLFKNAESKFFTDEELNTILEVFPDLTEEVEAAKSVRSAVKDSVKKVVNEVFSQYDYESAHENARAKCPRDIRYVVAYATQSMISHDPKWFDNKVLIWLKTILQSFEFPARNNRASAGALFADKVLETRLKELPQKTQSTYHTYYRLRQEMSRSLPKQHFTLMEPYLTQALETLTEEY